MQQLTPLLHGLSQVNILIQVNVLLGSMSVGAYIRMHKTRTEVCSWITGVFAPDNCYKIGLHNAVHVYK